MRYACKFDEKQIELDNYKHGEISGQGASFQCSLTLKADTLPGLLEKIAKQFDVEPGDIFAGNGNNTIAVSRSENVDGEKSDDRDFEEFKLGRCKLWNATYWGTIQRLEDVSEDEINAAIQKCGLKWIGLQAADNLSQCDKQH